jgi:hypothetical protein
MRWDGLAGCGHRPLQQSTSRAACSGAVDARLISGGRVRYVDESRIGAVGAFAVNGGSLTELAGSPASLPARATPSGIAVSWFLQQRTLRRYDAVPVTAASRPVKSSPQGPQARR